MNIKIKINKETLEWRCDDPDVKVVSIKKDDYQIEIEVSKPDQNIEIKTWQQ